IATGFCAGSAICPCFCHSRSTLASTCRRYHACGKSEASSVRTPDPVGEPAASPAGTGGGGGGASLGVSTVRGVTGGSGRRSAGSEGDEARGGSSFSPGRGSAGAPGRGEAPEGQASA